MEPKHHEKIFTYIGIAAIALLLFGLAGWYFFIARQTASLEGASNARGFSIGIPSFLGGARGSNAANTAAESVSGSGSSGSGGASGGQSAFLRFLGIGQGTGQRAGSDSGATSTTTGDASRERKTPRFWRVSTTPIAGAAFVSGSTTKLRYIERTTGNVFDVNPNTGETVRRTNTLTPKVYDALVAAADVIIERTLDESGLPVTLTGKIGTSTEDGVAALAASNLGEAIRDVATTPSSSDVLLLLPSGGGTKVVRAGWNGANAREIAAIPAGDFRILWPSSSQMILAEKAGSGIAGSAYIAGNPLTPLLRNILGLLVQVHSSGALLYSSDDGAGLKLFARLPGASDVELPIPTIADKCVWAPGTGYTAYCAVPQGATGANFLDTWYRGAAHTEDTWYTVTAGAGTAEKLFTMSESSAIDVERPVIDGTGSYLAFLNARDKSLWILRISEN